MDNQRHIKLKKKMVETFEHLKGIKLERKSQNLWFYSNEMKLCVMTSKTHLFSGRQKYWYTLTYSAQEFLDPAKTGYVFLGCLDNNKTAYLIPFVKYKKHFLDCDTTETGWHIRINHQLQWYFQNKQNINLLQFEKTLI